MKTIQISVERNFHCMNDDRFIMEKISMTAELDENDYWESVTDELRERIEKNFKAAYPKVEDSLNFHVVRQISPRYNPKTENFDEVIQVNNDKELTDFASKISSQAVSNLISQSDEKINKGTIEESCNYHSPDIEAIKKEIQSYKYGVKALKSIYGEMVKDSPELKKVFDEKVGELENQKQNSIV